MSSALKSSTHAYGSNAVYIAEMYERYLQNPQSVDASWQEYFRQFGDQPAQVHTDFKGGAWGKPRPQVVGYVSPEDIAAQKAKAAAAPKANPADQAAIDSIHAHMLVSAYRVRGHLIANLDPLGLAVRQSHPDLELARYGFSDADMEKEIIVDGWLGMEKATLRTILNILHETYCSNVGVEMGHIQSQTQREWLQQKLEFSRSKAVLSGDEKKKVLQKLVEAVGFEEFLHKKYPGTKRFSAEGGESLLIAMEAAVEQAAAMGLREAVVGMPHRGRLNVLTAFMGKSYTAMLSEFQGNLATPDWINSSGDVKYHLGISTDKNFNGRQVHLSLTPNPSHLEAVNPVVMGKVRAKQDQLGDADRSQVMGILLHGDAAFCGQGVVAESLAMSDLKAYDTGGVFHIIVNNQVGFTTNPYEGHTSPYPTDIAMMTQAPIFHVNGEDPEAVVHVARIAAEYRQIFKKDVFIDLWCYRKHGHNEGDEPRWTQPKMYQVIDTKQTPREIYAARITSEGALSAADVQKMQDDFYTLMDKAHAGANDYKPNKADMLEGKWSGLKQFEQGKTKEADTGVDLKTLKEIGNVLGTLPAGLSLHKGVERVFAARKTMNDTGEGVDWGMGELLAFGSLLLEKHNIRITGQDVIRGTFSHRHSGITEQNSQERYFPINNIRAGKQGQYEAHNSNLSEFAVLGFEYGYSTAEPNGLTIWEAQFGDFYNGAQTMVDQFIASAEVKWLRMSGLVMLLPHGYEGQGPEHSSGRVERFLQMSAEDNWIIANCTTPANYFHILRRQLKRDYRKPLILFSPKSLLRHKRAQSTYADMAKGTSFLPVIGEQAKLLADAKIRKVLLCSGKVYYDLMEARETRGINDVAILRLEQLYPFPHGHLQTELKKYKNADVVWCQEEPENMGGWQFVDRRIEAVLKDAGGKSQRPNVVSRKAAAATACGYMKIHNAEVKKLLDEAFA